MAEIEHLSGDKSHGPVAVFLDDAGKVGFVCRVDGAYWEGDLTQLTPPADTQDPSDNEPEPGGRVVAPRVPATGAGLLTMTEARVVAKRARG